MKLTVYPIILILISQTIYAQNKKTLSNQLWAQVQSCYSMFEDSDGEIDSYEIIDDSKNGYLKVSGSFPTCGCYCENTVGAYKTNSNKYFFVKKYFWGCSWKKGISSSESLTKLFPFDFEVDGFFQRKIDNPNQTATFYLDFEIPKKGTDTKVIVKPIPFGILTKSTKHIAFGFTEENRFSYSEKLHEIRNIVTQIEDSKTITYLLNNNFGNITEEDNKIITKAIDDEFENKEALIKVIQELKKIYDLYTEIKYDYLILGWNRDSGNFYMKEKKIRTNTDSFLEFLKNNQIWAAYC